MAEAAVIARPSVNEQISNVVRALLAIKGMSRKEMAVRLGVDEDTLARRLNCKGKHGWLADEIAAMAEVLDVDIELFFTGIPGTWFGRRGSQPSGGKVAPAVVRALQLVPSPRHVTLRPHSPRPLLQSVPTADTYGT